MPDLRPYIPADWPQVERIYVEGIKTGLATFETIPSTQSEFETAALEGSRLVASLETGIILGWAALWPVSDRCAYGGVAEVSVYVSDAARGQGIGRMLLMHLVGLSEELGMWTIESAIIRGNTASIRLHEACGFRTIGHRERVGEVEGVWHDTILMERRSKTVGV